MVAVVGIAVRLMVCWPNATTAAKGRIATARSAAFKIALKLFIRIVSFLVVVSVSVRFVDYKFPGINQHHHQHSAGENVVGGDFALVVGVPHERVTTFVGRVGLGVGGLLGRAVRVGGNGTGGGHCSQRCIRAQIR